MTNGKGPGLQPLGPFAGGTGIGGCGGSRSVQAGGGVWECSFITVMEDSVGPHPSADQDEEPGRRAGEQVLMEAGACHGR